MVDVHRRQRHRRPSSCPFRRARAWARPDAAGGAAVDFLLDAARTWGSDLIYVPTGPLTNLARAIERDAQAMRSIGGIVFMGGALTIPGNVTPGAEANIANDPEAGGCRPALGGAR